MTRLRWHAVGQKRFETGVDRGVLYRPVNGEYTTGVPWNGLTTVTESPSGAEATPQYADNTKYLNLQSAEEFAGTIEAFTSPREFDACDGTKSPTPGVGVTQQNRESFGFAYRNLIGNDTEGTDHGYRLHLVYGALASPSEKSRTTINDSPEAATLSWEFSTTPVDVPLEGYKPSAHITIDSTAVSAAGLTALENALYGTEGSDPRLPLPEEVFGFFTGAVTTVEPVAPTQVGNEVTIPTVTGVEYRIDGEPVTGTVTLTEDEVVTAHPLPGYAFPDVTDADWFFNYTA